MWSLFIEPFLEFEFLRRAVLEAVLLGLGFSVVGLVLVTRRLSLIGDTLSHAMLPGVVLAFTFFGPHLLALFLGGWMTSFLLVVLAWALFRSRKIEADAALALFAVFSVSLGILLASQTRTTTEILHLLFGNILAIDRTLLLLSGVVAALTWALFVWNYRAVFMALVDPLFFQQVKRPSFWLILGLGAVFSANLTIGFASLGAMMTVGLLIVPALVGRLLGHSPLQMALISFVYSAAVSVAGVLLSFHAGTPSGPAIVCLACLGLGVLHLLRGLLVLRRTEEVP